MRNSTFSVGRWCRPVAVGLLVALLSGCAANQQAAEAQAERQETVDQILSQPLDAEEYGAARRCISQFAYRDFQALGDRHVVFKGPGGKLWLNELRGNCPGLRHSSALAFDLRGSQICELDRFKVTDWFMWSRFNRPPWDWLEGIPCTLGKFQPVTADQVEALQAALNGR